jgi:AcrR family transcriptional regulator
MARLNRIEQVERNRALVLDAARRVFLQRGYGAASVEAIAEEAGFSKGVIYSQFESKADLFLALLEARIEARATQNAAIGRRLSGREAMLALLRLGREDAAREGGWAMLLIEFRAHAARDAALGARYGRAHARTVERLAATIEAVHRAAGLTPAATPPQLARMVLALGAGRALEEAADPGGLPLDAFDAAALRLLGL